MSSSAERMARKRERDRFEAELRERCELISREMVATFPGRDRESESGRAERALAYWRRMGGE